MTTAPIPVASYLANLTMNFYDVDDVRTSGNATIQVAGGTGVIDIPVAQGVRGLSTFAGTTIPTSTVPTTAVTDDLYVYGGAGSGGVVTGDVLRKAGDLTWSVVGTVRGTQGTQGIQGLTGGPASGLPLGLTGATAATRWVGGTVSGPPTSGTFLAGDYVTSEDGGRSTCITGGSPGTWENSNGNTTWRHGWNLAGASINPSVDFVPTTLSPIAGNGTIATYNATGDGRLVLNRAGRWSLQWFANTDSSTSGGRYFSVSLSCSGSPWSQMQGGIADLMDRRTTGDNVAYSGATTLVQRVAWTGYFTAAEAALPIYPHIVQNNKNGVSVAANLSLVAEYLGA